MSRGLAVIWQTFMVTNFVVLVAYFLIGVTIVRGLIATAQLSSNG